jgi:signal peptidase I
MICPYLLDIKFKMQSKKKKNKLGELKNKILKPWRKIGKWWVGFLERLPAWLRPWVRDAVDVFLTVSVIIVVLRLLLGADMLVPMVVVTSTSMVHESGDMSWRTWMTTRGISNSNIDGFPMIGGFNMGDMIIVSNPKSELGDIIIFERDLDHLTFFSTDPIIHRVVGEAYIRDYEVEGYRGTLDCIGLDGMKTYIQKVRDCQLGENCVYTRYPKGGDFKFFITKGDNNEGSDQCNPRLRIAHPVTDAQVRGKAYIRLPYLGWPKLILSTIWRVITLQI